MRCSWGVRALLSRSGDPLFSSSESRLETARREMDERSRYEHVVVNDEVGAAVARILAVLSGAAPRGAAAGGPAGEPRGG